MSGKRYPEDFKIEAVKQVVDRGYSVSSVATRLDITTHSLYARAKSLFPQIAENGKGGKQRRVRNPFIRHVGNRGAWLFFKNG